MAYATFEYYQSGFKGSAITDGAAFESAMVEAEAYINQITMGRITEASEAVKNACCAVAEVICKQSHDDEATISSESVGNHSRSYTTTKKTEEQREAEKYRKATLYLSRTGLLYRGLR